MDLFYLKDDLFELKLSVNVKVQNAPDLVKISPCFTSGAGINEVFEDQYFRYPNLIVLFSLMKGLFKLKLSVIVKLFLKD
jgi:hypothetical protein